ncbi:5-formyltetrahydrofolate cyclo-ligase [Haloactinopolyspora alba]|uniref:5-formyltetrahydrofolate cyclo-ligase n=1 Tax=Haloactinopolyspora alba TaxID=648780 RepID=UPI000D0CC2E4|nr:5-formyltetrahydrofolate cyclo-ligase [Haloactinopolyspora alba]
MSTSTPEAKKALRARILSRRAALKAGELARAAASIRDVALAVPEVAGARRVAAYVSVGSEPGTGPLIETLSDTGVEVLLPQLQPDGDLDWAPYEGPQALVTAARGLLEPAGSPLGVNAADDADALLVPGLAADRSGGRLGRGGGSYDRVLARQGGRRFTCVLLHDGEVMDIPVPREPHDVPVTAAATPSGLHRFR